MSAVGDVIDMRKRKKALYISLLEKGLRKLSKNEKQILRYLAQDEDIHLMLKNGCAFKEET